MVDTEDRIQKIELDIPDRDGSSYNSYKGKTYLLTRCPSGSFVNKEEPIKTRLFEILNVFYWNGVPKEFLGPVVFHELIEAEEMYGTGLSFKEAHEIAKQDHMDYAKRFLDDETLRRFVEWQGQYLEYRNGE